MVEMKVEKEEISEDVPKQLAADKKVQSGLEEKAKRVETDVKDLNGIVEEKSRLSESSSDGSSPRSQVIFAVLFCVYCLLNLKKIYWNFWK